MNTLLVPFSSSLRVAVTGRRSDKSGSSFHARCFVPVSCKGDEPWRQAYDGPHVIPVRQEGRRWSEERVAIEIITWGPFLLKHGNKLDNKPWERSGQWVPWRLYASPVGVASLCFLFSVYIDWVDKRALTYPSHRWTRLHSAREWPLCRLILAGVGVYCAGRRIGPWSALGRLYECSGGYMQQFIGWCSNEVHKYVYIYTYNHEKERPIQWVKHDVLL